MELSKSLLMSSTGESKTKLVIGIWTVTENIDLTKFSSIEYPKTDL